MTDREIKALKPKEKIYRKSCNYCGLMIRVMPTGRKFGWHFRHHVRPLVCHFEKFYSKKIYKQDGIS